MQRDRFTALSFRSSLKLDGLWQDRNPLTSIFCFGMAQATTSSPSSKSSVYQTKFPMLLSASVFATLAAIAPPLSVHGGGGERRDAGQAARDRIRVVIESHSARPLGTHACS